MTHYEHGPGCSCTDCRRQYPAATPPAAPTPGKRYGNRDAAAAAWLRRAKAAGQVVVLGGGWWKLPTGKKVQGIGALADWLERRGALRRVPAAPVAPGWEPAGLWDWQLYE